MLTVTCRSPLCTILHLLLTTRLQLHITMHQLRLRITESLLQLTMIVTVLTVMWQ